MKIRAGVLVDFSFVGDYGIVHIDKGAVIEYERTTRSDCEGDHTVIQIFYNDKFYFPNDFAIEAYVRNLPEVHASADQYVQIRKFDSVHNTNEFLKNIPKENIIKIEPLENNTYLVTYSEEKK